MATNRRNAVKGGFKLLGAAVAMGTVEQGAAVAAPESSERKNSRQLILHGRDWRISSQDLRRGQMPKAGVRMLATGDLVESAVHGRKIGSFFATYYRLSASGKCAPHEPGSLEVHTFVFPHGTITGTGIAPAGLGSEAHFAITGGTGRYHGARGSYTGRQSYADLGGDGTATFSFTLI